MRLVQSKARQPAPSPTVVKALADLEALAIRGMEQPASLSSADVSKMCRLAFVALARQGRMA